MEGKDEADVLPRTVVCCATCGNPVSMAMLVPVLELKEYRGDQETLRAGVPSAQASKCRFKLSSKHCQEKLGVEGRVERNNCRTFVLLSEKKKEIRTKYFAGFYLFE